ncbi:hypothetical protein Scep_003969 [Stephania cephalantha]|uniref:Uncharacterized protein n=1 Tax=Stephania cephalantha TaxID=152367 RepID=A0AAP0KU31_9MAGN
MREVGQVGGSHWWWEAQLWEAQWWEARLVGSDGGRCCYRRYVCGRGDWSEARWWETSISEWEASTGWRGWWEAKAIVGGGNGRRRWEEVNMCDITATSDEREAFSNFMATFISILPLKSREEALNWAQDIVVKCGFFVIILKSDVLSSGGEERKKDPDKEIKYCEEILVNLRGIDQVGDVLQLVLKWVCLRCKEYGSSKCKVEFLVRVDRLDAVATPWVQNARRHYSVKT